jgi:hypothetical protein
MLKALDENPEHCGYTPEQIAMGLHALEHQSVKQIGSDASQLYYLLVKKNLISKNAYTKKLAKQHSEITKLRFDQERSNLRDIPLYIRNSLFSLLKEYADGIVIREGRKWQEFKPDESFFSATPYILDEK